MLPSPTSRPIGNATAALGANVISAIDGAEGE